MCNVKIRIEKNDKCVLWDLEVLAVDKCCMCGFMQCKN